MFIDKREEILIKTRRNIFGQNVGGNPSLFSGNGLDFKELREYDVGDDVRKINWKVTAKAGRPFVNLFNEERELNIVVAFMVSGSIYFGTRRFKQELMAEILALLSYSTLKNDDRLSTLFFSDREEFFMPPTKKMGSLHITLEKALGLDPLEKVSDFNALVHYVNERIKRRSLIFVVSDFYGDVDLSLLNKHEVFGIMVRDRFEEEPKLFGEMDLIDPTTMHNEAFMLSPKIMQSYRKALEAHDEKLFEHFAQHRIKHTKIYTDEEPFIKLSSLFRH
ncbi:DUF58 domain-containing protein [Sulfurimonas sp. HSL3-7]|uniref:DUF58 domain-containing protein n=1 Tax=Sulfonitrofixus jiaomeiensis TaxID=3131938 RepID=UPI0031F82B9A